MAFQPEEAVVMLPDFRRPDEGDVDAHVVGEKLTRQQAIRQIERRSRFWIRAATGTLLMVVVAVIWAFAEYHNAGGWPTKGFSQSSGIPNVWNYWIIYPAIAWVLLTGADALRVFWRKPITEAEIEREIDRQAGQQKRAA
ncbi:MAG TPA: 2TM domain-containing protein [Streptosporangiaceae bacterium]|nr:2TM domain-containing protein [Streptosporangiaceae bacterium]